MSRFVQVLGPAVDGEGMTLDETKLRQMLCDETVKGLPVVVLAVVGPRGSGKTTLLSAVQSAIAGSRAPLVALEPRAPLVTLEPRAPLVALEPRAPLVALEPRAPLGSAGAAVWPELLPVTLPAGRRAMLLLLDTWGPFDDSCPAQQRASVLLFSALISSLLVVQTSDGSPVSPLGDLALLAKLGAAAQDVQHCTALQELVLLIRDWRGPAPAGRQVDFAPLYGWAQGDPAASQALTMMIEAADWYGEGAVSLFLAPDQAAGVISAADPVALLAAPRAAKRFDEVEILAGELADYIQSLAAALAGTPCDAASLLHALVEANQRMAARAAEPGYEKNMERMWSQWRSGSVSEQELRGAHDRAAHDALMAFTMSTKMDSESMDSEKLRSELLARLEKQNESKWETMSADTKKLENDALEQGQLCKETYETYMEDALKESPRMTMAELIKKHDKYRLDVLSKFEETQGSLGHLRTQQRMDLSDELEGMFRKFASKLDQGKEEADVAEAEKSLVSRAENSAKQLYRDIMEAVKPDKVSGIHGRVQECAKLQFDSKTKDVPEELKSEARERLVENTTAIFGRLSRSLSSEAAARPQIAGRPGSFQPSSYQEEWQEQPSSRSSTGSGKGSSKWWPFSSSSNSHK